MGFIRVETKFTVGDSVFPIYNDNGIWRLHYPSCAYDDESRGICSISAALSGVGQMQPDLTYIVGSIYHFEEDDLFMSKEEANKEIDRRNVKTCSECGQYCV